MSEENNIKTCKGCGETKKHILDKKYDFKNKKFIDENKEMWNGRYCSTCHARSMKIRMKFKRENSKKVNNE